VKVAAYECDLCHERANPDELLAMIYDKNFIQVANHTFACWPQSDTHVCYPCARGIWDTLNNMAKPKERSCQRVRRL
jgi:hypothetical protein